jgi:midasin
LSNEQTLKNLKKLLRAINIPGKPILIEGPSSTGKTSLIEFLANTTGNRVITVVLDEQSDM